ncbi:hypothetical protein [Motilibacter deserti]|uniref:Uncharacterized protein n=1 Tax=Motilibacter deserti TaxID=2714956 RepID=A0ABX0GV54_9ACTN|nr:hypothetical protein [Motilibacter deserti]NHC14662.1 hypothetical protein [Motilibacter deserti]
MTPDLDFCRDEEWLALAVQGLAADLDASLTSGPHVRARARRRTRQTAAVVAVTAAVAAVAVLPTVVGGSGGPAVEPGGPPSAAPLRTPGPGEAPQAFCDLEPVPAWCTPGVDPASGPLLRATSFWDGVWGDRPVVPTAVPATFGNLLVRPQDQLEAWTTSVVGGARTTSVGWVVAQTVVRFRSGTVDAAWDKAVLGLRAEAGATDRGIVLPVGESALWVWSPTIAPGGQWLGVVRHGDLLAHVEITDDPAGPGAARLRWSPETLEELADAVRARLDGRPGEARVRGELEVVASPGAGTSS